ncbi:ABC transporter permease [Actinomadura chibensis]|uniref:ABC transporter permease n=1 Tax=Actinomadura chibensis TaxID=392828 RepID=A0A5D0N511_9ACTN|nr:ABC transporter permease [Actinomadura chibensis]TYB39381.1 ABC transporter permease [Actinomadura chibensis]
MRHTLRIVREALILGFAEMGAVYTWRTWTFGWLVRLLCQATFYALLGGYVGDDTTMRYVLVGNIVVLACMESTIVVISLAGERRMGTLPLLAIAPSGHLPVYLGRGLQWTVTGLVSSLTAWLVLPPLLGVPLPWPRAGYAIPVIVLILASSYGYGCALAGVALRTRGAEWLVLNFAYGIVMTFGGVNVPVSVWPGPLRTAANALPVVHGLEAVRGILDGAPIGHVAGLLATEALVGACWYAVAAVSMDRLVSAGRRDGTLDHAG